MRPLRDTDRLFYDQRPSSICIRIRCLSSGFYPLCLPSDEPNEIMGIGAVRFKYSWMVGTTSLIMALLLSSHRHRPSLAFETSTNR